MTKNPTELVDHLFRHQYGKMVAVLTRIFGISQLELVEDVVQDTFIKALGTWKFGKIPDKPEAWLMRTARNRAIDLIRRNKLGNEITDRISVNGPALVSLEALFHEKEIADNQLRMIFAACHPILKFEDRVVFTLNTISGLSSKEISLSLLQNQERIKKRLQRAKRKLREGNVSFDIPTGRELIKRLDAVHNILYLLFNEGYNSSRSDELIRRDLCAEAMRLCRLMCDHVYAHSHDTQALMALMCFHAARFESRLNESNEIILFEDQDRSNWDYRLVQVGNHFMNQAVEAEEMSVYHLEAAIAGEHFLAVDFKSTNWVRLAELYNQLYRYKPSPMVLLNKIVVQLQMGETQLAYRSFLSLDEEGFAGKAYLYHTVGAEVYQALNDPVMSGTHLDQALASVPTSAERRLLELKKSQLT